jgi:hypothetical protein
MSVDTIQMPHPQRVDDLAPVQQSQTMIVSREVITSPNILDEALSGKELTESAS